ncbi:hypothetical protein [Streptomyces tsukubensis]|uniref:Uncharacterized protein n=1 Tax=Streptomyces tsukubensis TaxID=83656 RepID=A0A1V3ZZP4_9ACTN|nr:hypothetical protein [Streptomyces tsukubensis]OON71946.1 hypothetical protein B1H18_31830 [Streptomyces tsukubensis]QFR96895.1 hypothetical protein GBW32_32425 [Streptomyces tsukubensis]
MTQQLAIIVLVDTGNALAANTLRDNVYLFDNMKLYGSERQGTGSLVTAVHGAHWHDGSQATEQVLNWLPFSLGSVPPTVPRGYESVRARQSDRRALEELDVLTAKADPLSPAADLDQIRKVVGTWVRPTWRAGGRLADREVLDVTGEVVTDFTSGPHSYPAPMITDIYGEAVDEHIMFPAEYGSPDLVTDGWYWSATVDSGRPGTYSYSMRIQLHRLVQRGSEVFWEPVNMTCQSAIRVTTEPKFNGFTGADVDSLPIEPGHPGAEYPRYPGPWHPSGPGEAWWRAGETGQGAA